MTAPDLPRPAAVILGSREAFHDALRRAFAGLATHGCREVAMCDETFADWPLNEPAVVDALTRWALPHRRMTVIARQYDELERLHPRWVAWRRRWSETVDCRTPEEGLALALPVLFVAQGATVVRLRSAMPYRGSESGIQADIIQATEEFDAISQRSGPAFPSTILGL
jgi:hypothetical protein